MDEDDALFLAAVVVVTGARSLARSGGRTGTPLHAAPAPLWTEESTQKKKRKIFSLDLPTK